MKTAEGSELPLLVKYLFTSERLSIQVHPNDSQAQAHGLAGGKEECWYILDCDEGASLGIGLTRTLSQPEMRAAIADGGIEGLISDGRPVSRGDFFFIPAGTVHAIGAGITLVEIQQNADVTYRLYDYGRPRGLHLEDGLEVSRLSPYPLVPSHAAMGESRILLTGMARFQVEMLSWRGGASVRPSTTGRSWFIPLKGSGTISDQHFRPGECWLVERAEPITGVAEGSALVAACDEPNA